MTPLLSYWIIALLLLLYPQYSLGFHGAFRPKRGAVGRVLTAGVPPPRISPSSSRLYFFGRKKTKEIKEPEAVDENSETTVATSTKIEPPKPSPQETAAKLRADAERARLEAQRMDAELTLRKIEALEKKVKKKKDKPAEEEDGAKLQEEIKRLSQKFKEQTTQKDPDASNNGVSTLETTSSSPPASESNVWATTDVVWPRFVGDDFANKESKEAYDELIDMMKFVPNVVKVLFIEQLSPAIAFNETAVTVEDKVLQAIQSILLGDFSCLKAPEPRFTESELEKARQKVAQDKSEAFFKNNTSEAMKLLTLSALDDDDAAGEVATAIWLDQVVLNPEASTEDLARLFLEYDYYVKKIMSSFDADLDDMDTEETMDRILKAASEDWFLKPFFRDQGDGNATLISYLDNMMDTMFPKSTTQLKKDNPVLPPQAKVDLLASEILPQTLFRATSRPEPVLGGFVIKGSSIPENDDTYGDKVIHSINKKLAERKYAAVAEAMTVTYLQDFTYLENGQRDIFDDVTTDPPVLYICGPNVARTSRPIQFSIVSAIGLATTWYLSLYPFLLNRGIASRVDEELAMIDAGVMTPDLSWLTELSLPLFLAFGSIQLLHEVAHGLVARAYGIKTFPPILVPSILTGITSSVTSLKTPPKNLNALFDFAISGPLIGMIASTFAIVVGSQLTGAMDATNFPALPLDILRQSTLGGGIINNVIGGGLLNVPVSALGSPAIAEMTVSLHPIAVAGYIGLIVNALSLLPIGTTDGGRVALTIFGRETKSVIGSLVFSVLLWFGVAGSDLFLYYFSFSIAFQSGNEIPAQNEVDKLSLSRVFLAVGTYVLAALTLIPFQ